MRSVGGESVVIGTSEVVGAMRASLERVAATDTTLLLTGETGTGKELAARYVHECSGRRAKRFVSLNCAAIPDTLLESELFGFERGAFSGATTARTGLFPQAHGGTLFLDEVGDMSAVAQAKILRAIEAREIVPLGGSRPVALDVRIIAATNVDLNRAMAAGRFRPDLYFRLNVVRIDIPPLRARRSDVPALLAHYLNRFAATGHARMPTFTDSALHCLTRYDWPGNVRELRNLVEASVACAGGVVIDQTDLPGHITASVSDASSSNEVDRQRERLLNVLLEARWNKSRAARQLRCSRMTLYRRMARLSIQR